MPISIFTVNHFKGYHGVDGPLTVSDNKGNVIVDLLKKAFLERGVASPVDLNGETGEGETSCIRLNTACKCISYMINITVLL